MNCWEILGIEPTDDRQKIQDAYERQLKFASDDEASSLKQAFREATGDTPAPVSGSVEAAEPNASGQAGTELPDSALDANGRQLAHEVVLQIKALLNDSVRSQDTGIWKAILCEPPADQAQIRNEIGRQLEPQVRPMAENATFSAPVAHFLGEWFGWFTVREAPEAEDPHSGREPDREEDQGEQPPQMVNFWPAVIGWIVGLAVLASLFGGMGGG